MDLSKATRVLVEPHVHVKSLQASLETAKLQVNPMAAWVSEYLIENKKKELTVGTKFSKNTKELFPHFIDYCMKNEFNPPKQRNFNEHLLSLLKEKSFQVELKRRPFGYIIRGVD